VHGCSLGIVQAASLFFRRQHLFHKLVAFSGRYDRTMKVESFCDLGDGYYDDSVYFHTPAQLLPGLGSDGRLDRRRERES
ncbi:esterase, partial [Rhizobium ruizarguesonis]